MKAKKIKMAIEHIEDAILNNLYSMSLVDNKKDISSVRLPVKTKNGLVEVTVNFKE